MYYPFLRGRQNELLAIRELVKCSLLSKKVIPIVEPIKITPTLASTLETFSANGSKLIWIRNPQVGAFESDKRNEKNSAYLNRLLNLVGTDDSIIQSGIYINRDTPKLVHGWAEEGTELSFIMAICLKPDMIRVLRESFAGIKITSVVPPSPSFRRIAGPKILLEDKFNKLQRNADYKDDDDEFFSSDHLYYAESGYVGFSDYSIIGEEYSESGFAPYAVAIHIVYFDEYKELRVHHFVSDNNDDISDPAGKFYEALQKLHEWNLVQKLDTLAMRQFEKIYREQSYPGLGVVKKLSLMHHLELMSRYLDGAVE